MDPPFGGQTVQKWSRRLLGPSEKHIEQPETDEGFGEILGSLSLELTRISAEIQSINSGFLAQIQQGLAETHAALAAHYRAKFDRSIEQFRTELRQEITRELKREFEAEFKTYVSRFADIQTEIKRIHPELETVSGEINTLLNDPCVELALVIRKRAELAELQAYLDGLRFAAGNEQAKAAARFQG